MWEPRRLTNGLQPVAQIALPIYIYIYIYIHKESAGIGLNKDAYSVRSLRKS
jgi:hypothetical protein